MSDIKLAKGYSIDAREYANRGNAILGIRNSGKSYTAMKIAEGLLDAGIPIMAFDPIGIWRNLKVGINGNKGFPVVVAGGNDPDLPLTVENVKDLVRAAMKENVSLIFDLYSVELANKSTWIKIVQEAIHILMYENKSLRHIFLEEAAEFIPQRLQPQHSKVYSEIERLARMGRNSKLGYTLINQRAEEVNKAILEISECSYLHKQVGKNSLLSVKKWIEVSGVTNQAGFSKIIETLPTLKQGECFVLGDGAVELIKVLPKKTFHPSPEKTDIQKSEIIRKVDVSAFVENMQKALNKKETDIRLLNNILGQPNNKQPAKPQAVDPFRILEHVRIEEDNKKLRAQLIQAQRDMATSGKALVQSMTKIHGAMAIVNTEIEKLKALFDQTVIDAGKIQFKKDLPIGVKDGNGNLITNFQKTLGDQMARNFDKSMGNAPNEGSGEMRMLKAAALFPDEITKSRMALISGMSPNSGTFRVYVGALKTKGLLTGNGKIFRITQAGIEAAGKVNPLPSDPGEMLNRWCDIIGAQSGAAKMLRTLFESYPKGFTKEDLGETIGMESSSGTFRVYIGKLSTAGLIKKQDGQIFAADELFQ